MSKTRVLGIGLLTLSFALAQSAFAGSKGDLGGTRTEKTETGRAGEAARTKMGTKSGPLGGKPGAAGSAAPASKVGGHSELGGSKPTTGGGQKPATTFGGKPTAGGAAAVAKPEGGRPTQAKPEVAAVKPNPQMAAKLDASIKDGIKSEVEDIGKNSFNADTTKQLNPMVEQILKGSKHRAALEPALRVFLSGRDISDSKVIAEAQEFLKSMEKDLNSSDAETAKLALEYATARLMLGDLDADGWKEASTPESRLGLADHSMAEAVIVMNKLKDLIAKNNGTPMAKLIEQARKIGDEDVNAWAKNRGLSDHETAQVACCANKGCRVKMK